MMALASLQQVYGEARNAFAASADQLFSLNQAVVDNVKYHGHAQQSLFTSLFILAAVLAWLANRIHNRSVETCRISKNHPPGVPGRLPVIGNLLQLKSQKPHRTITDLSERYGPIFQLDLGALKYVVLTSPELAKEAAVTKFERVSKRNILSNLKVWTKNKKIVAMADYGDEYRKLKKLLVGQVLGAAPQKLLGPVREQLLKTAVDEVCAKLKCGSGLVNVRESIKHYIFPFVMHQIMGYVPQSVYVKELGYLGLWDIFDHLVVNPMKSVIVVDWRDFIPFFNWIPNPAFEKKVVDVEKKRSLVIRALIEQKRKLLQLQGSSGGFLEHMLKVETDLSSLNVELLTWEPIIEGSDTSLATTEWAMYELAKNPNIQPKSEWKESWIGAMDLYMWTISPGFGFHMSTKKSEGVLGDSVLSAVLNRLYEEIEKEVGSRVVVESDLPNLPLLDAVLKETLRLYPPIVLLPPREVEEDITIGGYHIPKGWQLLINVYGISNDKTRWANCEQWIPDRFLNGPEIDIGVNDFQFIPFGLGKRRCAGVSQAMTVVCSFIARFVQQFHWSLPTLEKSFLEDTAYLTTQKLRPLEAIARPRGCNAHCNQALPSC